MVEEIDRNLFRIEVPLPQNPLKSINCYVVKGPGRSLIIDSGLNREECRRAVQSGLASLGVNLSEADFFITHLHADHLALATTIAHEHAKIYFNQPDAARIEFFVRNTDDMARFAQLHGFPEPEIAEAIQNHPGVKYGMKQVPTFHICREGDTIAVGDYLFSCVETPGHSFGHMCLYEPRKKYLVSGDHILGDITPNIQSWFEDWNPLILYEESLDKTYTMDVRLVLPGHRSVFLDCRGRIEELKQHHVARACEVLTILKDRKMNAYEVASEMTWDIVCDSWEQFPVAQKWFAVGETIAHLRYLEAMGKLQRETTDGGFLFMLSTTLAG